MPPSELALEPLSPRARWWFHLRGAWTWLVYETPLVAAATGGLLCLVPWQYAFGIGAALWLLATIGALWIPAISHYRYGWALDDSALYVSHGVWVRSWVAIPTSRIQHVDLRQGPVEQLLGLSRLYVYTAAGGGADGVIPGLDHEVAETLRAQLIGRAGDDGV